MANSPIPSVLTAPQLTTIGWLLNIQYPQSGYNPTAAEYELAEVCLSYLRARKWEPSARNSVERAFTVYCRLKVLGDSEPAMAALQELKRLPASKPGPVLAS